MFPVEVSFCYMTFKFILFIYLWVTHKTSSLLLIKQRVHVDARHFFHVTMDKNWCICDWYSKFFVCVSIFFSCASYSKPLGFVLYVLPRCPWQANQIHCTGLSIQIHDFDVLNHMIYDCIQSNYSGIFVVHTCTMHNSPYNEMADKC